MADTPAVATTPRNAALKVTLSPTLITTAVRRLQAAADQIWRETLSRAGVQIQPMAGRPRSRSRRLSHTSATGAVTPPANSQPATIRRRGRPRTRRAA
jgi:hypothetical protein